MRLALTIPYSEFYDSEFLSSFEDFEDRAKNAVDDFLLDLRTFTTANGGYVYPAPDRIRRPLYRFSENDSSLAESSSVLLIWELDEVGLHVVATPTSQLESHIRGGRSPEAFWQAAYKILDMIHRSYGGVIVTEDQQQRVA